MIKDLWKAIILFIVTFTIIGCTVLYLNDSSGNTINTRGLDSESESEVSNLKDEVGTLDKDINNIDVKIKEVEVTSDSIAKNIENINVKK
jgi:peptidoglycan hydrolase CwlO-like protein